MAPKPCPARPLDNPKFMQKGCKPLSHILGVRLCHPFWTISVVKSDNQDSECWEFCLLNLLNSLATWALRVCHVLITLPSGNNPNCKLLSSSSVPSDYLHFCWIQECHHLPEFHVGTLQPSDDGPPWRSFLPCYLVCQLHFFLGICPLVLVSPPILGFLSNCS